MPERKQTVLIVDDEEVNRSLVKALLMPLGYESILASNGQEALAIAGEREDIDLVLLDFMMPGMDGLEVIKRLKDNESTRMIPIVMVTGMAEVELRIKALQSGADDLLGKPINSTELKVRVQSLLQLKAYNDQMVDQQQTLETEVRRRTSELEDSIRKLKTASLDTVNRLSAAAEYKDEDTGIHIVRMSLYAAAIAKAAGLDAAMAERILYAAPMHDIGKIGIPDRILLKPGQLDSNEWVLMKQHTEIGAKILANSESDIIRTGEQIALTHHEKWDGAGYPRGLKGCEIPIEGRITAVADVFDALTSRRPYKEPFPLDQSFNIIMKGRDAHFDPDIVDAFLNIRELICAIRAEHQDQGISPLVMFNPAEDDS